MSIALELQARAARMVAACRGFSEGCRVLLMQYGKALVARIDLLGCTPLQVHERAYPGKMECLSVVLTIPLWKASQY